MQFQQWERTYYLWESKISYLDLNIMLFREFTYFQGAIGCGDEGRYPPWEWVGGYNTTYTLINLWAKEYFLPISTHHHAFKALFWCISLAYYSEISVIIVIIIWFQMSIHFPFLILVPFSAAGHIFFHWEW